MYPPMEYYVSLLPDACMEMMPRAKISSPDDGSSSGNVLEPTLDTYAT